MKKKWSVEEIEIRKISQELYIKKRRSERKKKSGKRN